MTEGPNGPVIDTLADVRYELMVLNEQIRALLSVSGRDPVAPVVEVLPAPVVLPPSQPAQVAAPLDLSPLLAALQGIGNQEVVGALAEMRKDITDLAGVLRAIGMGNSSYGGGGGPSHVTAEIYSKAGLTVSTEDALLDTRYEWQAGSGSTSMPKYIGTAAPGTASSADGWKINRFTYIVGPSGDNVPSLVQSATGAWDNRASLFS